MSEELIDRLRHQTLGDCPPVAVDIAAADGKSASNTYALFKAGWAGLAVEPSPALFARLGLNYIALDRVTLHRGWITPSNVLDLLDAAGVPREFGLLSLDIDGYDHDVLASILSQYRPRLISAEINERFPPPILFNVTYSPTYGYLGDGFFGQSISMLDRLRAQYDYALVGLDYINAFLVPNEIGISTVAPSEAFRTGYLEREDRTARFVVTTEFEPLLTMTPESAVDWIRQRFRARQGEFVWLGDAARLNRVASP